MFTRALESFRLKRDALNRFVAAAALRAAMRERMWLRGYLANLANVGDGSVQGVGHIVKLRQVLPVFLRNNIGNLLIAYAIATTKGCVCIFLGFVKPTNFQNISILKFGITDLDAAKIPRSESAFLNHVERVIFGSSQEKMTRINTWRIVASVQYIQFPRDVAVGNNPRNPVRQLLVSIPPPIAVSLWYF